MSHIPPASAIFSPSVARAAASTAKDWNYVDAWLHARLTAHGRSHVPAFERNPDTLRVLLALATLNETADEERELVSRADALALQQLRDSDRERHEQCEQREQREQRQQGQQRGQGRRDTEDLRDQVLSALEDHLPREAEAALDALSSTAIALGVAYPNPATLADKLVDLQYQVYDLEQMHARVSMLHQHVETSLSEAQSMLHEVQVSESYRPAAHMAKQNLELQRKAKALHAKLPELRDRVAVLAGSVGTPNPTVDQVVRQEAAYLELLAQKKDLAAQIRSFQGLPPDADLARQDLEALRTELRNVTQRRDAVFEGLVERETPRKPRR